ncbi:hypothetical protein BKA56DRAFT_609688 [Ilyonectria sp. MPI-CAGE-AT-0026]|nr:hypothetical protein BKA56DRAFT_609688 [Ilyonectria sp. MPI-CAGE-AT-0026]
MGVAMSAGTSVRNAAKRRRSGSIIASRQKANETTAYTAVGLADMQNTHTASCLHHTVGSLRRGGGCGDGTIASHALGHGEDWWDSGFEAAKPSTPLTRTPEVQRGRQRGGIVESCSATQLKTPPSPTVRLSHRGWHLWLAAGRRADPSFGRGRDAGSTMPHASSRQAKLASGVMPYAGAYFWGRSGWSEMG